MTAPIRIHATDDEDMVRSRHADIERRLEELGRQQVMMLLATGGLPTGWNLIVHAWLDGKLLEKSGE